MRVLYFSDTYLPKIDGVALSIKNFTEHLSLRGFDFLICCPKYGEGDFSRAGDNVNIERFRCGYLPSYPDIKVVLPNPRKIKRIFKEFKPDLVHIHTPGLLGLYAINAARKYKVPTLGTYHTLMAEQNTYVSLYRLLKLDKLFLRIEKLNKRLRFRDLLKFEKFDKLNIRKKIILKICNNLYNKCDVVISPSHLIKKQLQDYGIKKEIAVVSNGMDLNRFKGEVRQLKHPFKLLHVGRISFEKNCDVVIKAFHKVLGKYPDTTLTIIGDGPALTSLKLLSTQLGIQEKVIFTGFIDNSKLHEVYPDYTVFVTASTMETQGLVILEAIACGLPAVGVDSFAIPELIHHDQNGFIAQPFKPDEMAEMINTILENPDLYTKFSDHSLKIASEHRMEHCVDKLVEVYNSTLEKYQSR